jgi:predicted O-methyltransferase YrrM
MQTQSGHGSRQQPDELCDFIDLLKAENVRSYLEIGACHGDTFHAVMSALPKNSKGVAVDLPESAAWGKPNSRAALEAAIDDLIEKGYKADAVWGDSASDEVKQTVFLNQPYDAVFIDGDHRYDGVKADWLAYGPLARIVAFHDIDGDGQATKNGQMRVEVPRLWREIKGDYRHSCEIIGAKRGMGIGVLWR